MAVTEERLIGRVRALYPNANLSTVRMSALAGRLSKKPKDDATDDEIDEVLKDFNDYGAMTFEEIAKADDKVRTLEASKAPKKEEVKKVEDSNTETDPMKIMMASLTALASEIKGLKEEKTKESVSTKFANDERVKNIPEIIRKGFMPTSDEDYEDKVEKLISEYTPYAEKLKLAGFTGEDNPASSTGGADAKKGTVKAKSAEEVKDIADSI